MEPKLLIHVTYQAKPGRGREFVRQIVSQGLRGKILAEDGCLQYDYFFSSESDGTPPSSHGRQKSAGRSS